VSLNGITMYSKWPYRVRNAVFHLSPRLILMRWYAFFMSSFVNTTAPPRRSSVSLMSGNASLFFLVTLLSPR
jgi:hypothetical protein